MRVTHGAVLDVAVDLRRSSPNFGKHVAIQLDEDRGRMLWIPIGFGHAFLAVTAVAGFAYKVTDYYAPGGSEPSCGMIRNWQSSGQLSRVMRSCRRRTRTARPFGMPRSLHEQRPAHTHFRFHCLAHGGFSDHAHPPCNHELSRLCQCSFVRTGSLEFWHGSAGKLLGQELGNNGVPQGPGVPVNRKIVLLSIR